MCRSQPHAGRERQRCFGAEATTATAVGKDHHALSVLRQGERSLQLHSIDGNAYHVFNRWFGHGFILSFSFHMGCLAHTRRRCCSLRPLPAVQGRMSPKHSVLLSQDHLQWRSDYHRSITKPQRTPFGHTHQVRATLLPHRRTFITPFRLSGLLICYTVSTYGSGR